MTKIERLKIWKINNPEKVREADKRRYQRRREKLLALKYAMSPKKYFEKLKEQNGLCAICKIPQEKYRRRFDVDHDHKTGINRSLLCNRCNLVVGSVREDAELVGKVLFYLGYHRVEPKIAVENNGIEIETSQITQLSFFEAKNYQPSTMKGDC
jgi:Recombination endonuclease VII